MKAGLTVWLDRPVALLADLAVAAEDAGFDDVWVPDHYFLRDVYVAQALMAERTERVRLGTAVAAAQLRHPALLASSAATIHELSGGRAIIGVGPGGFEFASQFGLRPRSPLGLVREAVAIIRDLQAGRSAHEGDAFRASGAQLGWDSGPMPVFLSARGPKMLELAGEIADGVIIHGLSGAYLDHARGLIASGAARGGRSSSACEVRLMLDVEIDDDEAAAIDRLRPRCTIMAGGSYADELIPMYGLDAGEVARLRRAVAEGDPDAAHHVTDSMVRAFALGGSVATVTAGLAAMRDAGVDGVILGLGAGAPDVTARQIRRMAPILQEVSR